MTRLWVLACLLASSVVAGEASPGPIESSLRADPPAYYDPATGGWRQVDLPPEPDDEDPAGMAVRGSPMSTAISTFFYLLVGVLLAGGIAWALVSLRRRGARAPDAKGSTRRAAVDLAALPFAANAGTDPEAALAAAVARQDWDRALVLLFVCQLAALDAARLIRLRPGKTNRRYLAECRAADPQRGSLLGRTVTAFERVYFGRQHLDRAAWERLAADDRGIRPAAGVRP